MWNRPTDAELRELPPLYGTESVPAPDKIIGMHFFFGSCDWYAVEFDGDGLFFGFVVLNGDLQCAEWGYFSLSELMDISIHGMEVDRDLYWKPAPAGVIDAIKDWI